MARPLLRSFAACVEQVGIFENEALEPNAGWEQVSGGVRRQQRVDGADEFCPRPLVSQLSVTERVVERDLDEIDGERRGKRHITVVRNCLNIVEERPVRSGAVVVVDC